MVYVYAKYSPHHVKVKEHHRFDITIFSAYQLAYQHTNIHLSQPATHNDEPKKLYIYTLTRMLAFLLYPNYAESDFVGPLAIEYDDTLVSLLCQAEDRDIDSHGSESMCD